MLLEPHAPFVDLLLPAAPRRTRSLGRPSKTSTKRPPDRSRVSSPGGRRCVPNPHPPGFQKHSRASGCWDFSSLSKNHSADEPFHALHPVPLSRNVNDDNLAVNGNSKIEYEQASKIRPRFMELTLEAYRLVLDYALLPSSSAASSAPSLAHRPQPYLPYDALRYPSHHPSNPAAITSSLSSLSISSSTSSPLPSPTATLARLRLVSKAWKNAVDPILYGWVVLSDVERISAFARTVEGSEQLAGLVEVLEISPEAVVGERVELRTQRASRTSEGSAGDDAHSEESEGEGDSGRESEGESEEEGTELSNGGGHHIAPTDHSRHHALGASMSTRSSDSADATHMGTALPSTLPRGFWLLIGRALSKTHNLKSLLITSQSLPHHPSDPPASACILTAGQFKLTKLYCDFDWDDDFVRFLESQGEIKDLYVADYRAGRELGARAGGKDDTDLSSQTMRTHGPRPDVKITTLSPHGSSSSSSPSLSPPLSHLPESTALSLHPTSLPHLAYLECTFPEAAYAIVPGRPVTHLKTCFSGTDVEEKTREMETLFESLDRASEPLRALDLADESYDEEFSMELLGRVVQSLGQLRYLGTFVLPVDGDEVRLSCNLSSSSSLIMCPGTAFEVLWSSHAAALPRVSRAGGIRLGPTAHIQRSMSSARRRTQTLLYGDPNRRVGLRSRPDARQVD